MQTPTMNGVQKTAEAIAHGPHVFNQATRKYEEIAPIFSTYPRAMFHPEHDSVEVSSPESQAKLESEGWRTTAFPTKVAKETVMAAPVDLASIILEQQQEMKKLQARFDELSAPVAASRRDRKAEEAKA